MVRNNWRQPETLFNDAKIDDDDDVSETTVYRVADATTTNHDNRTGLGCTTSNRFRCDVS